MGNGPIYSQARSTVLRWGSGCRPIMFPFLEFPVLSWENPALFFFLCLKQRLQYLLIEFYICQFPGDLLMKYTQLWICQLWLADPLGVLSKHHPGHHFQCVDTEWFHGSAWFGREWLVFGGSIPVKDGLQRASPVQVTACAFPPIKLGDTSLLGVKPGHTDNHGLLKVFLKFFL